MTFTLIFSSSGTNVDSSINLCSRLFPVAIGFDSEMSGSLLIRMNKASDKCPDTQMNVSRDKETCIYIHVCINGEREIRKVKLQISLGNTVDN